MNISIESVVNQVSSQIEESPVKNLIASALQSSIDQQKTSIEELLLAKQSGDLTETEFEVELDREKQIVEAEMLTWQITSKAEIQKVVNKTFHVLAQTII